MDIASIVREKLGEEWLPGIYRDKVRTQRTRSYHLNISAKPHRAEVQYTLLGIELKVGSMRFSCPDLATARYLRVFARVGCADIAVPYDITKISSLADELEISWHKTLLFFDELTTSKTTAVKSRQRNAMIKIIRGEIEEIGAGELMPEFKKSTKQRPG